MVVWIVNPFDNLPLEGNRPQRYWLMAEAFVRAGNRVILWTSDFSHATKRRRENAGVEGEGPRDANLRVVQIPTLPYPTNVCLARIRSHHRLARDFERKARDLLSTQPSLVIASTPPLSLCAAAMRVARSCGAAFVCDIQDAWPETFERILPWFVWSLIGMRRTAKRLYCGADGVSAVAKCYLALAKARGSGVPMRLAGHAIGRSEDAPAKGADAKGKAALRLVYAGNMSLSYDLATVIDAMVGMEDVSLDIAGNGPDRADLASRVMRLGLGGRVRFHGYLGERELAGLLRSCDVGIVPMFPESRVGVPGKLADYAAAGLRVIESLGGECQEIVERHGAGTHYAAGDMTSFRAAVGKIRATGGVGDESGWRRAFDAQAVMDGYVAWCDDLITATQGRGNSV